MRYTTLDYLNIVAPYVPPQLMSAESISCISKLAAILPPSSNFGFECKLGSGVPEADFLVAVIPSDGSRGAWAGENTLAAMPEVARPHPAWKKVQSLLADWNRGADGLDSIRDTWLEFDLAGQISRLPLPSFFFGFDDSAGRNYPELTAALVERLLERPLSPSRRERLHASYVALPPDALILQVGVMLSRPTDEVRLCTRRLTREEILCYLERIDWPGPREELRSQIDALAPFVDAISLDLAVDENVLPQIGLECSIEDGARGRARVKRLLAHLISKAVCVPTKGEALLHWLGYCTERSDESRWPAHLLKASMALGTNIVSTFARTLNHIKVTYKPGEPITAKAYLGVRHYWARTGSRNAS